MYKVTDVAKYETNKLESRQNKGCYFYRLVVQSIFVEVSTVYGWENINNERYGLNFKRNESRL